MAHVEKDDRVRSEQREQKRESDDWGAKAWGKVRPEGESMGDKH